LLRGAHKVVAIWSQRLVRGSIDGVGGPHAAEAFSFVGDHVDEEISADNANVAAALKKYLETPPPDKPLLPLAQASKLLTHKSKLTLVFVSGVLKCRSGMVLYARSSGLSVKGNVSADLPVATPLGKVAAEGKLDFACTASSLRADSFQARDDKRSYTIFVSVTEIAGVHLADAAHMGPVRFGFALGEFDVLESSAPHSMV